MVEYLGFIKRLKAVNSAQKLNQALNLYSDPAYSIVYRIIKLYKSYPNWLKTPTQTKFNKTMAQLQIKIEHDFALHQNFGT